MESVISEFFEARREAWLKKNTKASMDKAEIEALAAECESIFALDNWLPNAAKRAGQISISTHPCTFSHSSARKNKNGYVTSVIANKSASNDGFLRSGNVRVEPDALGNAAALDVYKFLTLILSDGQTLLSHIEQDSEQALALLTIPSTTYEELKFGLLAMVEQGGDNITSSKIKQVYFPVDDDYHQLSLLSASGLVFELKQRINHIRFSEETKTARAHHKAGEKYNGGYKQIGNVTSIGYGGTKPQNISVLNNQNAGTAHLLSCLPPIIEKRTTQFPTVNFFKQSIHPFIYKDIFLALHRNIFTRYQNNWAIRQERAQYYQEMMDHLVREMLAVRHVASSQYRAERSQLPESQRIWLTTISPEIRATEDGWLDDICQQIALFMFKGYEKVLGSQAIVFSDEEFTFILKQVENNREALR